MRRSSLEVAKTEQPQIGRKNVALAREIVPLSPTLPKAPISRSVWHESKNKPESKIVQK